MKENFFAIIEEQKVKMFKKKFNLNGFVNNYYPEKIIKFLNN